MELLNKYLKLEEIGLISDKRLSYLFLFINMWHLNRNYGHSKEKLEVM